MKRKQITQLASLYTMIYMAVSLISCGETTDASTEEFDLCACVQLDDQGNWDMQLSPACMQQCITRFGPELQGMEAWFQENCDFSFTHPKPTPPKGEQRI